MCSAISCSPSRGFWIRFCHCISGSSSLLTWVRPDPYNPVVRTLNALTEPVLYRIRKWLPFTYISGLDLSPIVVLIAIQLVQSIVVRSLFQYAAML